MTSLEWGPLLLLSVLWGGPFVLVGVALREVPPFSRVTLRLGIKALVLNAVLRLSSLRLPSDWRVWRAMVAMGLINNALPFSLLVWGQTQVTSVACAPGRASRPRGSRRSGAARRQ
ncbi:MAG: DMT family transporter [Alphaproteobacteria bacterium]|nr:DMT family transporter [Alphaproteobacteria bacterium]